MSTKNNTAPRTTTTTAEAHPKQIASPALGAVEPAVDEATDRILSSVSVMADHHMAPVSADDDLPLIGYEDTVVVRGGNLSDLGFAKMLPGWEFRGFVVKEDRLPSEYGDEEPVTDDTGKPVMVDGKPVTRKMQKVLRLFGTAMVPVKGMEGGKAKAEGKIKLGFVEALKEPVADIFAAEKAASEKAGRKVKIGVEIKYLGQAPDRKSEDGSKVERSGRHLFEVRRIEMAKATGVQSVAG